MCQKNIFFPRKIANKKLKQPSQEIEMQHDIHFVPLYKATTTLCNSLITLLNNENIQIAIPILSLRKLCRRDQLAGKTEYGCWVIEHIATKSVVGYALYEPKKISETSFTLLTYYIAKEYLDNGYEMNIWLYISQIVRGNIGMLAESPTESAKFYREIGAVRNENCIEHNGKKYWLRIVYRQCAKANPIAPPKSYAAAACDS